MNEDAYSEELLSFFKALADANRLKIVGLLAQQPRTVEELARLLELGASTTSHHLARLAHAGLVTAQADGHYYIYSLRTDVLQGMAQHLLSEVSKPVVSTQADIPTFDRKVMQAFTDEEGRIKAIPMQEKKLLVLLHYVVQAFEAGRSYTERQVNEILSRYNEDTARLRRDLVDYHFMARKGDGSEYWLVKGE